MSQKPAIGRARAFAQQFDATLSTGNIQQLYGDTGYFNVGYWTPETPDLRTACDRLVDEVLKAVPAGSRWILDAGCGLGSGTCRIAERHPGATVLAGNISPWQLAQARARGVATAVAMDAVSLPIRSGALDAVVAIESPQHFDTREAFLGEAFRTLRPGGALSMTDMLFSDADVIGGWMIPDGNRHTSLTAYTELLRTSGFIDVTVDDVTDVTWRPFCGAMRAAFGPGQTRVDEIEASVSHYVLVRATRGERVFSQA